MIVTFAFAIDSASFRIAAPTAFASGYKIPAGFHAYSHLNLTLRDQKSQSRCIIFIGYYVGIPY